jgi:aspartyl-tRNA(Asn)/glutamyl-tRNA(Gln) amidotransferase subunit C
MADGNTERVLGIAALARINITEGQDERAAAKTLERFADQFADIVKLMDTLAEVDTTGVEPLYQPLAFSPAPPRDDAAVRVRARGEILANAPEQDGAFFIVPRIV